MSDEPKGIDAFVWINGVRLPVTNAVYVNRSDDPDSIWNRPPPDFYNPSALPRKFKRLLRKRDRP